MSYQKVFIKSKLTLIRQHNFYLSDGKKLSNFIVGKILKFIKKISKKFLIDKKTLLVKTFIYKNIKKIKYLKFTMKTLL